jgi:hypothetical protein
MRHTLAATATVTPALRAEAARADALELLPGRPPEVPKVDLPAVRYDDDGGGCDDGVSVDGSNGAAALVSAADTSNWLGARLFKKQRSEPRRALVCFWSGFAAGAQSTRVSQFECLFELAWVSSLSAPALNALSRFERGGGVFVCTQRLIWALLNARLGARSLRTLSRKAQPQFNFRNIAQVAAQLAASVSDVALSGPN